MSIKVKKKILIFFVKPKIRTTDILFQRLIKIDFFNEKEKNFNFTNFERKKI